jgi:hypothetical protein
VLQGSLAGGQFTLGSKLSASSTTAAGLSLDIDVAMAAAGQAARGVGATLSATYPGDGCAKGCAGWQSLW